MPNIPEFNAPSLDIRPSEIGVESTAAAGRRLGVYGSQIAQTKQQVGSQVAGAVKSVGDQALMQAEHMEISAGANHGAGLVATLNQSWNNTAKNADPNDAGLANKWRAETLEPALEQFQQGFLTQGGQQWAERFAAGYREHAVVKTAADMSSLAADAVHVNAIKTINGLSSAAFNDPSTINFAKDTLAHSLDGLTNSSPTMSATDAAKVKGELTLKGEEQIVKSAIMGAIVKGGNWQSIANDPKNAPYVNGPEIKQFENQEKFYQRGAAVAQKQELLLNKQLAEQDAHTAINKSFSDNVHADDQGHVTINPQFVKDMVNLPFKNPNAPDAADKAKTWIDWTESQQKPPPKIDNPQIIDGLMKTISDPAVSLDNAKIAIAKAEIAKGMTPETSKQITQIATDLRNLNDPVLSRTLENIKPLIEPKYGGVDTNPGAYARFYYDFIHNQYQPAKVAGTLPPDALDTSNPESMISKAIKAAQPPISTTIQSNGGIGAPPLPVYTAPKPGATFTPPLNWQTNGKMYRDPAGKLYDLQGKLING